MKMVAPLVLGCLVAIQCHAASTPPIDGMAGLPLGSGTAQMASLMDERGAHLVNSRSTPSHFYYENGTFQNQKAALWHFHFTDNKLYSEEVVLNSNPDRLAAYAELKKSLAEKYGDPVQDTKTELEPAELMRKIREGKVDLLTTWIDYATGHSITCKLALNDADAVCLRVVYKDDKIAAKMSDAQKNDL